MESEEVNQIDSVITSNPQEKQESTHQYLHDILLLRDAIIENCMDCIRDCGNDCLDSNARPLINIRCPLQRVRMELGMIIQPENIGI